MRICKLKHYFVFFMLLIVSCTSLGIVELRKIQELPNTKLIQEGNKISLRYYFNIPAKFKLRYKEPLFIKSRNEIIAIFLFREYKKVNNAYIQTFFSVGADISLKAYLRALKSKPLYIIDSTERIIKVIE